MENEQSLEDRLSQAAKHAEGKNFDITVLAGGIRITYRWEGSEDRTWAVSNFTTWEVLRLATDNPLIKAMTSLTKQAGELG